MDYADAKQAAILELKRMIKRQTESKDFPRLIGGIHNLTLEELLQEVEKDTEIGKSFVRTFDSLRKQFPK